MHALPAQFLCRFSYLCWNLTEIRQLRDELASKRKIVRFYQDELLPGQRQILNESLLNYNAMEIGNFELFTTNGLLLRRVSLAGQPESAPKTWSYRSKERWSCPV